MAGLVPAIHVLLSLSRKQKTLLPGTTPRTNQEEASMISLADQQRRIEKGALTPEAALAESFAAIDAQEETIKAFVHRAKNPRARSEGPLRGIAVGIKDIVDTADMPTEMGCPAIYRGNQPRGKQTARPSGIWYTPTSGIWQTVWMEPVPAAGHVFPFTKGEMAMGSREERYPNDALLFRYFHGPDEEYTPD